MQQIDFPFHESPPPGVLVEIVPGLKWLQMPLPGSLNHINLYLIEDHDGWYIVDTGLGTEETQRWWQHIFDNELRGKPVIGVIVTHMHPDHIGQAGWLTEHWQAPLLISDGEYHKAKRVYRPATQELVDDTLLFYSRFGLDQQTVRKRTDMWVNFKMPVRPVPENHQSIGDGDELVIGRYHWRVIVGRGHSPEHACLFCEELNILISGDQILPNITSNVSIYPGDPELDPLNKWLISLNNFYRIPADTLVLPAHNKPFYGLHHRAGAIIEHHEQTCISLEQACRKIKTGKDLIPVMFKRELNEFEWALAIGECSAHLNYLTHSERLMRHLNDAGHYLYELSK